jgi:hypothetical protein
MGIDIPRAARKQKRLPERWRTRTPLGRMVGSLFPPGVFNVVTGDGGEAQIDRPGRLWQAAACVTPHSNGQP